MDNGNGTNGKNGNGNGKAMITGTARTMVYKFGVLAPTENGDLVLAQMRQANAYYNELVALERNRREEVRAIYQADDDVTRLTAELEASFTELTEERQKIKATRISARKRIPTAVPMKERVKAIRELIGQKKEMLKVAKKAALAAAKVELARIEDKFNALKKEKRAAFSNDGLFWGTYLIVEQAFDAAKKSKSAEVHFRRWRGDGTIAVQLQGGLSTQLMCASADQRLVVDLSPLPIPGRGLKNGKSRPLPRVRLRVGSKDRQPVWAEFPVVLHRSIPEDGIVSWAKIHRRITGTTTRWELHLTIKTAEPVKMTIAGQSVVDYGGPGIVAIDLGWRSRGLDTLDPKSLRVAYWEDKNGTGDELLIDAQVLGQIERADTLRRTRDNTLNVLKAHLHDWLAAQAELPMWLVEEKKHMHLWKAPRRFVLLERSWRNQRFSGDEAMYEELSRWRKHDRHLWNWEANSRRKGCAHRLEQYRRFAALLARSYDTAVLEYFDIRSVAELPTPEEEETVKLPESRHQRFEAAVSELRTAIEQAFVARGGRWAHVNCRNTTRQCQYCDHTEAWEAWASIYRGGCPACGQDWDQDQNACAVLLSRFASSGGGDWTPETARPNDSHIVKASWAIKKRPPRWHKRHRSQDGSQPVV